MSTPKPGQIRCPTCHESTPPGAFCTRCGQPIPSSARARPRGLDRQELEDRLRGRRPTDSPYRRGAFVGDAEPAFDQFEPEPEDSLAVRPESAAAPPSPRQDHFVEPEPQPEPVGWPQADTAPDQEGTPPAHVEDQPTRRWPREAPHRAEAAPPQEPQPRYEEPPRHGEPEPYGGQADQRPRDDERQPAPPPAYIPPEAEPYAEPYYDYGTDYDYQQAPSYAEERSNTGPWLIVGIIGLGLVALLGGVLLSGLFGGGPGVARETPSPTAPVATATATPAPEQTATPAPSSEASAGPPGTFADGFTATVQPCATTDMNPDGCVNDGSTISGDTVWVWAGFKKGTGSDVVGVTLVDPETDEEIQDASLELSDIDCAKICKGYINFKFSGLSAGDYVLRVTRNGTFAAEAPFTVS